MWDGALPRPRLRRDSRAPLGLAAPIHLFHATDPPASDIRIRALMPTPSSNPESGLRHQLTAGQMTMVAVGGSTGTGLLLGTPPAIQLRGPAVILSFVLAAFI